MKIGATNIGHNDFYKNVGKAMALIAFYSGFKILPNGLFHPAIFGECSVIGRPYLGLPEDWQADIAAEQ